ncbi:SRPBCC family protein [Methylocella sp.]|uniref:SRPBCC family protein n=1 Tax=Methylocella sp. TaxID=1978226 RepID=UPI0037844569
MARILLKSAFVGAALAASLSAAALAHGPTRQKVVEKIDIKASPDKVWAVIGNFQDMSWHPAVKGTTGEGGNTVGAKRTIDLGGGAALHEELTKYDAADHTYSYRIPEVDVKILPVNNYSSTIDVKPTADGSEVEWHGAFYRGYPNNDPPPELNEEAAIKAVTGIYTAGLQALKKKVEATN